MEYSNTRPTCQFLKLGEMPFRTADILLTGLTLSSEAIDK